MNKDISKDFEFLKSLKEVEAVLVYGSKANKTSHEKSDIDICIIAPSLKNSKDFTALLSLIWRNVNPGKYDIRIFEELPLYIKMNIINNHKLIFAKDTGKLYEYFYFYRKLWSNQAVAIMEKEQYQG